MSVNKKIGIVFLDSNEIDNLIQFATQFGDVFIVMPYEVRTDLDLLIVHSVLPSTAPPNMRGVALSRDLIDFYSLYYPKYKERSIPILALENACVEAWKLLQGTVVGNIAGHKGFHGIFAPESKVFLKVDSRHDIGLADNSPKATVVAYEFKGSKNTYESTPPKQLSGHYGFVEIFESPEISGSMNPAHLKQNRVTSGVHEETGCMYGDYLTIKLVQRILRLNDETLVA